MSYTYNGMTTENKTELKNNLLDFFTTQKMELIIKYNTEVAAAVTNTFDIETVYRLMKVLTEVETAIIENEILLNIELKK
jgi:hypothetical protein